MDTQTLIDVVALIDAKIAVYTNLDPNEPFYKGALRSLESLRDELQLGIDSAVASMETSRESGE
jgi:hypothetical protein